MKFLAIDFGQKRVGTAISDRKGIIAQPLRIIKYKSDDQVISELAQICIDDEIDEIVLGIPLSAAEEVQDRYREFQRKLKTRLNKPVHTWDETFTTKRAQNMVAFSEAAPKKVHKESHRDDVAAAIILQEFLNSGKAN